MSKVVQILLREPKRGVVRVVNSAEAIIGKGLSGDRYAEKLAHTSWARKNREVTLIESEALVMLRDEKDLSLTHEQSRRNLLTEGVDLNALVGKTFRIGSDVVLRGLQLCQPCQHLEETTAPGMLKALFNRGGLRATIVAGGVIRAGDAIELTVE
ncbi:MAG: MOSC domain-containing protein [Tepidisphaeraceae bacterium]